MGTENWSSIATSVLFQINSMHISEVDTCTPFELIISLALSYFYHLLLYNLVLYLSVKFVKLTVLICFLWMPVWFIYISSAENPFYASGKQIKV